jgi:hypothetical protein
MPKLGQLFMTAGDMERWFAAVEQKLGWKIKFVPYGLFHAPQAEIADCRDIPSFGVSASGDRKDNPRYFIFPVTAKVIQVPIQLNDGGTRYKVNPLAHPGMVALELGGVCASTHIVTGEFGTANKDEVAVTLNKTLWQVLRKQCTISGTAAVGPEALELHRAGYRLNDRLTAKPASDLVIRGVGKRAAIAGRANRSRSRRRTSG